MRPCAPSSTGSATPTAGSPGRPVAHHLADLAADAEPDGRDDTPGAPTERVVALSDEERMHLDAVLDLGRDYLAAVGGAGTVAEFVAWLDTATGGASNTAPGVDLVTFHRAKGLEWSVVFVTGLERGLVPISWAVSPDAQAEERRLLHVALSRAEDEVHCSWAQARSVGARRSVARTVAVARASSRTRRTTRRTDSSRPARGRVTISASCGRRWPRRRRPHLRRAGPGASPVDGRRGDRDDASTPTTAASNRGTAHGTDRHRTDRMRSTLPLFPSDDGWPYPDAPGVELAADDPDGDAHEFFGPHAFDRLTAQERAALCFRFGFQGSDVLTMKELAPRLGCSRAEAGALIGRAIDKMRTELLRE